MRRRDVACRHIVTRRGVAPAAPRNEDANAHASVRSIGVAVKAGSLPETRELTHELGDDEIEIGMGARGEPGVERRKLMPADELADEMTRPVVDDLPLWS